MYQLFPNNNHHDVKCEGIRNSPPKGRKKYFVLNTKRSHDKGVSSLKKYHRRPSQHATIEDVVLNYLTSLQERFDALFTSSSPPLQQQEQLWANVWVHEEALMEANHDEAMALDLPSHKLPTYLTERKERVLDFLWSICRDASVTNMDELRRIIQMFAFREEKILQLYTIKFISCRS
mmetsp:Transcript_4301/g.4973  ORF Transcript_4301/g.4973 Transcript_4301/m.4973 type:complete len:177 (+) Transcript_4301:55-585(+)